MTVEHQPPAVADELAAVIRPVLLRAGNGYPVTGDEGWAALVALVRLLDRLEELESAQK